MKKLLILLLCLIGLNVAEARAERPTFTKGATSQTIDILVYDSSSTTGAGLTGLVFNTSNLVCYYRRGATGSATQITLATQTVGGAYSSGGFVEISAANMPGVYRLDLPDAVLATGVDRASLLCKGAANMVPVKVDIELIAINLQDAVRGGMAALPNAAAEAAGGLYTRGTGAGQINQPANGMIDSNVVRFGGTAGTFSGGRPEVNTTHWSGTANAAPDTAGYPKVTLKDGVGVGEIDTNGGAVVTVTNVTTVAAIATVTAQNGNTSKFNIPITQTGVITADGLYKGNFLVCGGEKREIVATDDNTTDVIVVSPGLGFTVAPSNVSCTIEK